MPPHFTTEYITVLLEELRQFSTTLGQDGVSPSAGRTKRPIVIWPISWQRRGLRYTGTQWEQYLRVYPVMTDRFPLLVPVHTLTPCRVGADKTARWG